jgi:hypothetical protein
MVGIVGRLHARAHELRERRRVHSCSSQETLDQARKRETGTKGAGSIIRAGRHAKSA